MILYVYKLINERSVDVRVSVTITDDMNKTFQDMAKSQGVSRDKIIGDILLSYLSNDVQKLKNERGAGRKSLFGDTEVVAMKFYRSQGMSYRAIAELYNCSAGLVHKLINEQ